MAIKNLKNKKRPLILNNVERTKLKFSSSNYIYSYKDSINKVGNVAAICCNRNIVNIDTMTEANRDPGDESYMHIDLDTMTKAYSDSGDDIRLIH